MSVSMAPPGGAILAQASRIRTTAVERLALASKRQAPAKSSFTWGCVVLVAEWRIIPSSEKASIMGGACPLSRRNPSATARPAARSCWIVSGCGSKERRMGRAVTASTGSKSVAQAPAFGKGFAEMQRELSCGGSVVGAGWRSAGENEAVAELHFVPLTEECQEFWQGHVLG